MPAPSTPRWLSPDERQAWLALMGVVTLLPAALDAQLTSASGMTFFEYLVMAGLSERPDRTLQLTRLARFANGSLSRLSHVITRLVDRGWVIRSQDPSNGRVKLATLTDEGYRHVVAAAPGHVQEARRLVFDNLTADQTHALAGIASTLSAALGVPAATTWP